MNESFLLEWSIKALIVLAFAWVVARGLRRQGAALRHLVWLCAMAAVLFLPVLMRYAPEWKVLPRFDAPRTTPIAKAPPLAPPVAVVHRFAPGEASKASSTETLETVTTTSHPWLGYVWLIGMASLIVRTGLSLYSLRALRTYGTRPFDRFALDAPREIIVLQALGDQPKGAMTWGVHVPVVLLPADAQGWSEPRIRAVLAHEFAHIRRFDFLSQLLSEIACAALWFLPPIWMVAREMRAEAELAADDTVLSGGFRPSSYAEVLLLSAAETGGHPHSSLRGASAMNSPKIETRIASVLSSSTRRGMSSVQALAVLAALVIAVPAISALRQASVDPKVAAENKSAALSRGKILTMGAMMYASDYDDVFPYVQQTASAVSVLQPYIRINGKAQDIMKTARGEFHYNLNAGGVSLGQIPEPASIPLWTEVVTDPSIQPVVGYTDGHVKLMSAQGKLLYDRYAKMKFPRKASMRPLPKDYIIKWPNRKTWAKAPGQ